MRKLLLNIACLEKVQTAIKQLIGMSGSVKVDMVRAILPKVQSPVLSNEGGGQLCWNGSFYQYITSTLEGCDKGILIIRCVKNVTKVMSVQPKSTNSFCGERTTVSTKGSNSYVGGGPELAVRNNFVYCAPKGVAR